MPFDSAAVVSAAQQLPEWAKVSAKALLALPFSFHSFNGLRHLAWDSGKCVLLYLFPMRNVLNFVLVLTLKGAYRSGYAVLGATAVTTVVLALM